MKALCVLILLLLAPAARAQDFDYWVLSLSWSPAYCAVEGDRRDDPSCRAGAGRGFIVHGLWPQYERGWPEYCDHDHRNPSRRETRAMADLMGSGGLAWHAWRKHGACSGLSPRDYFAVTRQAAEIAAPPGVFDRIDREIGSSVRKIESAFASAHPNLKPDAITVTCRRGLMMEARICLDKTLAFRACAPDAARDCPAERFRISPLR